MTFKISAKLKYRSRRYLILRDNLRRQTNPFFLNRLDDNSNQEKITNLLETTSKAYDNKDFLRVIKLFEQNFLNQSSSSSSPKENLSRTHLNFYAKSLLNLVNIYERRNSIIAFRQFFNFTFFILKAHSSKS